MQTQNLWNISNALNITFPSCKITGSWPQFCQTLERLRPVVICKQVQWIKPLEGRFKLNTDGSFMGTNARAGIGGVVRNDSGNLIMAFSIPVQCHSNNQAEAIAAKYGVDWCNNHNITKFDIEIDSLIIANMVKNQKTVNLKLSKTISDILDNIKGKDIQVQHCYRESNQVADFLAELAASSGNGTFYYSFQQLPKEVKGAFQLGKCQLQIIRIRYEQSELLCKLSLLDSSQEENYFFCLISSWKVGCPIFFLLLR